MHAALPIDAFASPPPLTPCPAQVRAPADLAVREAREEGGDEAVFASSPQPAEETGAHIQVTAAEISPLVFALHQTKETRGAMMRTSAGLAASLPFAVGAAARGGAPWGDLIEAVLSVPVSLALVALVGVSASTIGVSFFAGGQASTAPVSPSEAIDMASRGVLRTGLVLLGLAPVTLLSMLSASRLEGLLFASFAWAAGGIVGTAAIARKLSHVGRAKDGTFSPGAVGVASAFTLFAWVFGARLWFPIVSVLAQTGGAE